jgi:outer membrane protein, heavy metal efflux system
MTIVDAMRRRIAESGLGDFVLRRLIAIFLGLLAWSGAPAFAGEDASAPSLAPLPPIEYLAQQPVEVIPRPEQQDDGALTLGEIEQLALSFNPTLAEAAARVRAARGEQLQVGLPPNPTVGYVANEVGNEGAGGQQGVIVGQEFIRGNKLGLNRVVAAREAERREQEFAAQEQRVLTDVRIAFFEAYLAQQRVELSRRLQSVGDQSVAAARALLEAQEGRRTDLLQAEIEGQRATADVAQAESALQGAWRRLAALVGQHEMAVQPLAADVQVLRWSAGYDETLAQLMTQSPKVAEARAEVDRARAALARACAEPIPDVTAQAAVQYDDATDDTIASTQITLPLPLWNRNQGGIAQRQAELTAARRRLEATERRLQHDLAQEYQRYETALARAETIRTGILDRAEQNLNLLAEGYRAGELGFLDLLTAQRTYFQVNLEYLSALGDLNQSVQMLNGLLLAGSYNGNAR